MSEPLFRKGVFVIHKTKGYVGRMDGITRIKEVFEDQSDEWEYRVVLDNNKIEIASPKDLEIDPSREPIEPYSYVMYTYIGELGEKRRCFKCRGIIVDSCERCPICNWHKCECGACGCSYSRQ